MPTSPDQLTVIAAPDSFKGSVSAAEAASAIARGVRAALGDRARVALIPLADGGEGTLEALLDAWDGSEVEVDTVDAIGRPRKARYGVDGSGRVAIIEAAEGNGLPAVSDAPLQPMRADSRGVGLIARDALDRGAREILLCIGGSASTDGGTGLLSGLGVRFLDARGREVAPGGAGLCDIAEVDTSELHPAARMARWRVAVDVDNPLLGERGAAAVFGPQKGATAADVQALDEGLGALAERFERWGATAGASVRLSDVPGLGAAGGLALALTAMLDAELVPGSRLVSEALDLPTRFADADLVITGEGSLDSQSLDGKVVDLVRRTAPDNASVVVIAGRVGLSFEECRAAGLTAALSIARGPGSLDSLVSSAEELIAESAAQAVALLDAGSRLGRDQGTARTGCGRATLPPPAS